jgi:hypothetical protein
MMSLCTKSFLLYYQVVVTSKKACIEMQNVVKYPLDFFFICNYRLRFEQGTQLRAKHITTTYLC